MPGIVVNGSTPFGEKINAAIDNLVSAVNDIHRVQQAAAAAQSGAPAPVAAALETGSNFGVVPSSTLGAQGAAFAFALNNLDAALQAFYTANIASITALDNG